MNREKSSSQLPRAAGNYRESGTWGWWDKELLQWLKSCTVPAAALTPGEQSSHGQSQPPEGAAQMKQPPVNFEKHIAAHA